MSQPDRLTTVSTNRCGICHERSTWEFLRDFYFRVESTNEYAWRLERDLYEATDRAQQSQHALTRCEASLANSWEILNQERLEHRASQEALNFERERHKESIELLGRVFEEAMQSGETVDFLIRKVAELQATSSFEIVQAVPQTAASTVGSPNESSMTPLEATTSASQQRDSAQPMPETCAGSSLKPNHSSEDEQTIQLPNFDASDRPECRDQPPSTELKSNTSCGGGRAGGSTGSKPRPIARKRTRLD